MVAAGRFVAGLPDLGIRHGGLATAGRIEAEPGIVNVIPRRVRIGLDLRHQEISMLEAMLAEVRSSGPAEVDTFWTSPPTGFDPQLQEILEQSARELGVATQRLISGPGHDSKYLAERGPSAMIFVRTERGRSHCEDESARWEDCVAGADVLLAAVLELAGGVEPT
jgi:N-carbamoyl-L-amino-acid hydrolase